jgi:glucose-6-phosphate isomerase
MSQHDFTHSRPWQNLLAARDMIQNTSLRQMFATDPTRATSLVRSFGQDFVFDFSRQRLTPAILAELLEFARFRQLPEKIGQMFHGEKVNHTENRAVLHVALRNLAQTPILVDGRDVMPDVIGVLDKIQSMTEKIHSGAWRGVTGKKLDTFVSVGIGGSYLGAEYLAEACKRYARPGLKLKFIANVDGNDFIDKVADINPETTLFIIVSKTFTTAETMKNAQTCRSWLLSRLAGHDDVVRQHFMAVSTNTKLVKDFGIDPANMFEFWDWVGGRFSVCSAVGGVPLALLLGYDNFLRILRGAEKMDRHFQDTPLEDNIPVLMGLLGLWNNNFLGYPARAILPYFQPLARFIAHIQQVDMESNGKQVQLDGSLVPVRTGEIDFGEPGTNGQHSFYQLIHQGQVIPADFIGFIEPQHQVGTNSPTDLDHHRELMTNFFAQPDALAFGKTCDELAAEGVAEALWPHKAFSGNRPSSLFLFHALTPETAGMLLALYEHRTAVQGFLWGLNSFDQWGVELGKVLAQKVKKQLLAANKDQNTSIDGFNPATTRLLRMFVRGRIDD